MNPETGQHVPDENVASFLRYLGEIFPKLAHASPEIKDPPGRQQETAPSGVKSYPIVAPSKIHRLIEILYDTPRTTIGEISSALSLPLSTVSRIVSTMEEQGIACRAPDVEDGRIVRVALTDFGIQVYQFYENDKKNNARRVLDCLTLEEQAILLTLLGKVSTNLSKDA